MKAHSFRNRNQSNFEKNTDYYSQQNICQKINCLQFTYNILRNQSNIANSN